MTAPLSIEYLSNQLSMPSATDAQRLAKDLLRRRDVAPMHVSGKPTPAVELLRVYHTRLQMKLKGLTQLREVGLAEFVASLELLLAGSRLGVTGFETPERTILFWSDDRDALVGTVVIERRSTAEEAERWREFSAMAQPTGKSPQ